MTRRPGPALLRAAALLLGVASAAPRASANGRAPATVGVFTQPGDDQSIYLATTFGLLISHDDGCTFHWVCEDDIGYGGNFDPKYAIAPDGTIYATTFDGLRVSHDGGCSFQTATSDAPQGDPGRIAGLWIDALDLAADGTVWAATASAGLPNDVYSSIDDGATFAPMGLSSPNIWYKSVKAAPSQSARVYVSGYNVSGTDEHGDPLPPQTHVFRSDNAGATWSELPLDDVTFGATPLVYVMAVAHDDPDTLWLRSETANPPVGDRLYRSTDGGMHWTEVLTTTDKIQAVVERSGAGAGTAGEVLVATTTGGSFRADDGATFTLMTGTLQSACLAERGDGTLLSCGANWEPDFQALGRSTDTASWSKVFRFVELAGPLDCKAGTAEQDVCAPQWPQVAEQFGVHDGGSCGAVDAGVAPDQHDGAPSGGGGGGCCDTGDAGGAASAGLGLGVLAIALRRRRRR